MLVDRMRLVLSDPHIPVKSGPIEGPTFNLAAGMSCVRWVCCTVQ